MQSSLFEPGRPVIFTRSTGERVDATMKGPSEKGDQFAVLEYTKAGQVVTQPCAPLQKIEFFIRSPSPSPEPTSSSQEGFPSRTFVGFSCFIACENMGVNLNFHVSIAFLCLHAFGNMGGG